MVTELATKGQAKALSLFGRLAGRMFLNLTFFPSSQETIEDHKMTPDDFSTPDSSRFYLIFTTFATLCHYIPRFYRIIVPIHKYIIIEPQ